MTTRGKLEAIASGDTEETLVLSDSFLGDEGCTALTQALRTNTKVTALDLRGCNIRCDGASALAKFFASNYSIKTLGLEWNGVGMIETGIQALCKVAILNSESMTMCASLSDYTCRPFPTTLSSPNSICETTA